MGDDDEGGEGKRDAPPLGGACFTWGSAESQSGRFWRGGGVLVECWYLGLAEGRRAEASLDRLGD